MCEAPPQFVEKLRERCPVTPPPLKPKEGLSGAVGTTQLSLYLEDKIGRGERI
jgi:hypothetical protein